MGKPPHAALWKSSIWRIQLVSGFHLGQIWATILRSPFGRAPDGEPSGEKSTIRRRMVSSVAAKPRRRTSGYRARQPWLTVSVDAKLTLRDCWQFV